MASDAEHIKRLGLAASFCMFDSKLNSSGRASIIWGVLNALIGGAILSARDLWGYPSLLLGLGLIAAGVYEKRVRDPKVIILSAATLGLLALWDFAMVTLAAMGHMRLALGGRTLYWAILQAIGAYQTWKTYSTYKMLRAESDPATVEQVREQVNELRKVKADQTIDVIEFEANAGFVKGMRRYRLKPFEDLYLITQYKAQLRSLTLQEISFVPRAEVSLTPEGEKWMSKKLRANVRLGPVEVRKVSITPEMAARINPAALAVASST